MHDLLIVTVTYNDSETIERCLVSVLANTPTSLDWKTTVVDNASADDTAEVVARECPEVELISNEKNLGFGAGNNVAMDRFEARYYYLHNPDAYLQSDVLTQSIEYLDENPEVGIVGFPLVFPDGRPQTGAYSFSSPLKWFLQDIGIARLARTIAGIGLFRPIFGMLGKTAIARSFLRAHSADGEEKEWAFTTDWVTGAAMLLRRELIDDIGGFDPAIMVYGEDEDLCIRANAAGWTIKQLNVAPVIHDFGWGKRRRKSRETTKLRYASLKYFIDKNFRRWRPRWLVMRSLLLVRRFRWYLFS